MAKEKVQWKLIRRVCSTHGAESAGVYGVRAKGADGTAWEWSDVDVSRRVVRALLRRLNEAQPESCHFEEIVRDFIEEQAIGDL